MEAFASRDGSSVELIEQPIRIQFYDPRLTERFEAERVALADLIGKWATGGIHHVGSTAVPGVDGEPVVDILVGIESAEASASCFGGLAQMNYVLRSQENGELHAFCKPRPDERIYDLHVVPVASPRYAEMLAFRDFLRADRQAAIGYAGMKWDLAGRFALDRRRYTAAKVELIQAVLASL